MTGKGRRKGERGGGYGGGGRGKVRGECWNGDTWGRGGGVFEKGGGSAGERRVDRELKIGEMRDALDLCWHGAQVCLSRDLCCCSVHHALQMPCIPKANVMSRNIISSYTDMRLRVLIFSGILIVKATASTSVYCCC